MSFTVADVKRFKNLLKHAEPTYHLCMPPPDYQPPPPCSDTHYTLYSADTFHDFLTLLTKHHEHMARYVFTASGHLCFGREGDFGKRIPEHWQMLGQETHIIAAGNIFVENGFITGLNDQSAQPTGLLSLIYTLRALHNHALPLANNLELIQTVPDSHGAYSSWMTQKTLKQIIGCNVKFQSEPDYVPAVIEEDDLDEDELFLDHTSDGQTSTKLSDRPPTPHSLGRFGIFYSDPDDDSIRISRGPIQKSELADASETRTTKGVGPTW
ncbi:MAG: hypothetical protein P1U39_03520 [Legionellaceae bacterium]|jgi:hypothetical protein|nr:hypothetical protein [Legionellaceae bacterium]